MKVSNASEGFVAPGTARATFIESYTVRIVAFASACASSAKARHETVSTADVCRHAPAFADHSRPCPVL